MKILEANQTQFKIRFMVYFQLKLTYLIGFDAALSHDPAILQYSYIKLQDLRPIKACSRPSG